MLIAYYHNYNVNNDEVSDTKTYFNTGEDFYVKTYNKDGKYINASIGVRTLIETTK